MTKIKISALKNQAAFDLANKVGRKNKGRFFILVSHMPETRELGTIYLGLKVSKKMGKAVVRNKIRRRIKHMFRAVARKLQPEMWESRVFVVIPKRGFEAEAYSEIEKDLVWHVKKITGANDFAIKEAITRHCEKGA